MSLFLFEEEERVIQKWLTYFSNCIEARSAITLRELRDGLRSEMNVDSEQISYWKGVEQDVLDVQESVLPPRKEEFRGYKEYKDRILWSI